jgi:hypothetical protein
VETTEEVVVDTEGIKKAVSKESKEKILDSNIMLQEELPVEAVEATTEEVIEDTEMRANRDLKELKESLKESMVKDKRVKRRVLISEVDTVEAVVAVAVVDSEVETSFPNPIAGQILSSEMRVPLLQERVNNLQLVKKESFSASLMMKLASTRSPCTTRTEVPSLTIIIIKRDSIKKRIDKMI